MAPDEERRGYPESGKGDFEGRGPAGRPAGRGGGGQTNCRGWENVAGGVITAARCARRCHPGDS